VSRVLTGRLATQTQALHSSPEEEVPPLMGRQLPLSTLLVAMILSGSLWWGIIAGLRYIWRAI
jgi:hypothetical protein